MIRAILLSIVFAFAAVSASAQTWTTLYSGGSWIKDADCCDSGYEYRQAMPPATVASAQIRVTFNAQHAAAQPTTFPHVSACVQLSGSTCRAAPIEQTCYDLPGLTLVNGAANVTCDPIPLALSVGDVALIIFDFPASGSYTSTKNSGAQTTYYALAQTWNQAAMGGSVASTPNTYSIALVEVAPASPPPPPPPPPSLSCAGGTPNYGGRLTLIPGQPELTTDTVANLIAYSPCGSNTVAVYDGTTMAPRVFANDPNGQVLNFVPGVWPTAGSIFDVVETWDGTSPKLALCPWSGGAPGSFDTMNAGVTVNASSENCQTSQTTSVTGQNFTVIAAIQIDPSTAGQISCLISRGLNRRCGLWNLANQRDLVMQAGSNWCGVASCAYYPQTGVFQCVFGNCANSISVLQGRSGGRVSLNVYLNRRIHHSATGQITNHQIGIGWNTVTAFAAAPPGNDTFEYDTGSLLPTFYHAQMGAGAYEPPSFQGVGWATALELQAFDVNGGEWNLPTGFALTSRSRY